MMRFASVSPIPSSSMRVTLSAVLMFINPVAYAKSGKKSVRRSIPAVFIYSLLLALEHFPKLVFGDFKGFLLPRRLRPRGPLHLLWLRHFLCTVHCFLYTLLQHFCKRPFKGLLVL